MVLALAAFFSYSITVDLLNEQKTDSQIQYRAYISEVSADVETNVPNDPQYPYMIAFGFKNSGITPAYNIKTYLSDTVSGTIIDQAEEGSESNIIGPGDVDYVDVPVSDNNLSSVLKGSGNFLTEEINYQDYFGENHSESIELVSQKGTPGWVNTLGILKQTEN